MMTFIGSLLLTRVFSIWNFLKARTEIILGSILFTAGCLILVIESGGMTWMFIGTVLFGISIGLVPPAILVLLSENENKRTSNLGVYNAIVAIASVFSPIIIGAGIAPVFLIPFNTGWEMLFTGDSIYSISALVLFLFLGRSAMGLTKH